MARRSPPSLTSSRRVTTEGGPDYVDPAARVAVFDNDGTLWTEKPLVIQLDFTIRRFREMAEADPALTNPAALPSGVRR